MLYSKRLLIGIPGCIALLANGGKHLKIVRPLAVLSSYLAVVGYYVVWSLSRAGSESTIYTTAPAFVATFYILTMLISLTCTSMFIP